MNKKSEEITEEEQLNQHHKIMIVGEAPTIDPFVNHLKENPKFYDVTVSDGKKALEKLEENHPDLILIDEIMPSMSGFEICRAIRKIYHKAKLSILMLLSNTDHDYLNKAFFAGANDYLTKPIHTEELNNRVYLYLAKKESIDERTLLVIEKNITQMAALEHQNELLQNKEVIKQVIEERDLLVVEKNITQMAVLEHQNELLLADRIRGEVDKISDDLFNRFAGFKSFMDNNNPVVKMETIYIEKVNKTPYTIVYSDESFTEYTARIADFIRIYGDRYPNLIKIDPSIIVNANRVIDIVEEKEYFKRAGIKDRVPRSAKGRTHWLALVKQLNKTIDLRISNEENKKKLETFIKNSQNKPKASI